MGQQKRHPLTYCFFAAAILIVGGSCIYSFLTHPVRQLLNAQTVAEHRVLRAYEQTLHSRVRAPKPPGPYERGMIRVKLALPYIWPDFLLAAVVYTCWLGCIYFFQQRFVVWLSMRGSGEMTNMRGRGLERKVLGANEDRKKPVV